jgi:hypothetical protein
VLEKLPNAIIALLLQLIACALTYLSITLLNLVATPMAFAWLCGLFAIILSYFAPLARWWLAIQLLFAPGLVLMLALNIPSGYFLAAFLVTLFIYWNSFCGQVPLYLSSDKIWEALLTLLPAGSFRFIDLGAGLGGVLTYLASKRSDGSYVGIESAPLPWLVSWLRVRLGGYRQCRVKLGSMWDCDLSEYDLVFAYLSPAPMERLWQKARSEMRPGSVFVSSTFSVPGQTPDETINTDDLHNSTLLIWRM